MGFTHTKGLSFQIFELEDSGLPQQGILPISARKTITKANHRCLEKDSPHCAMYSVFFRFLDPNSSRFFRLSRQNFEANSAVIFVTLKTQNIGNFEQVFLAIFD